MIDINQITGIINPYLKHGHYLSFDDFNYVFYQCDRTQKREIVNVLENTGILFVKSETELEKLYKRTKVS